MLNPPGREIAVERDDITNTQPEDVGLRSRCREMDYVLSILEALYTSGIQRVQTVFLVRIQFLCELLLLDMTCRALAEAL